MEEDHHFRLLFSQLNEEKLENNEADPLSIIKNSFGENITLCHCLFSSNETLSRILQEYFPERVPMDVNLWRRMGGEEVGYFDLLVLLVHSGLLEEENQENWSKLESFGLGNRQTLQMAMSISKEKITKDMSTSDLVVETLMKLSKEEWNSIVHLPVFPAVPVATDNSTRWREDFFPKPEYCSLHQIVHSSDINLVWSQKLVLYKEKDFPFLLRSQMAQLKSTEMLKHLSVLVEVVPNSLKKKDSFIEREVLRMIEKEISSLLDHLEVNVILKKTPFVHSMNRWYLPENVNLLESSYEDKADVDKNVLVPFPRYLAGHVNLLKKLGARDKWENIEPVRHLYPTLQIETRFERFLFSEDFADIEFMFNNSGEIIYAHRLIMTASSPKFESQFLTGKFKESNPILGERYRIQMKEGADPKVLMIVLTYIYTGLWCENDLLWADTLELAEEWCLDGLKKVLENYMLSSFAKLNKDTVIDLLEYSRLYNLSKLESYCLTNIKHNRILLLASKKTRKEKRELLVELFGRNEIENLDKREKEERDMNSNPSLMIRFYVMRDSMDLPLISLKMKSSNTILQLKKAIIEAAAAESTEPRYYRFRRVALRQNHTKRFASDVYCTNADNDSLSEYNFENQPFIYLEQSHRDHFDPLVTNTFMITFKLFDNEKGIPTSLCDLILPSEMTIKNLKKYLVDNPLKERGILVQPEDLLLVDEETESILNKLLRLELTLEKSNLRTGDIVHIEINVNKESNIEEKSLVENYFKIKENTTILYIEESDESYKRRVSRHEEKNEGKEEISEEFPKRQKLSKWKNSKFEIIGEIVPTKTFSVEGLRNYFKDKMEIDFDSEDIQFYFQERIYSGKWIHANEENLSFLMTRHPNLLEFSVEISSFPHRLGENCLQMG